LLDRLQKGEPFISDDVWLRVPGKVQDLDASRADYIPTTCFAVPAVMGDGTQTADANRYHNGGYGFVKDPESIGACVSDMKTLIDRRFVEWMDTLAATTNDANAILDVTVIGAGLAGGLAGGVTSQIMNAVSSGLTGTKTTINQDIFLSQSLQVVITQMDTDRTKWATIIESKVLASETIGAKTDQTPVASIANKATPPASGLPYATLSDAMNDLQTYSRQGSFQNALYNLQTNASAQSAACQADNLNLKSGGAATSVTANQAGAPSKTPQSATPTTKCQTPSAAPANK